MAPGCFSMTQQQQQQQPQHDNKQASTLDKLNNNLEQLNENGFYLDLSSDAQSSHELACSNQIPLPDGIPPARFAWEQLESQNESSTNRLDLEDHPSVDSLQFVNTDSHELFGNVTIVQTPSTTGQTTSECMGDMFTFASDSTTKTIVTS